MAAKLKTRRGRHEGSPTQLPSGSWRVQLSLGVDKNGRRIRVSVTADTKNEAMDIAARRKAELVGVADQAGRSVTLGQWLARWLEEARGRVERGTSIGYASRARRVEGRPIASVTLARLRAADVRAWLAGLQREGVPAGERAGTLRMLRAALNEAVRRDVIASSPADARKVPAPRCAHVERRAMTAAQSRAFAAAAAGHGLGIYAALSLDSGLRPGEMLGLRWSDIEGRTLTVRRAIAIAGGTVKPPKTAAGRRSVTLSRTTAALLAAARPDDQEACVVGRPGRAVYRGWLYPRLRAAAADAGVPWATPYTTRHTMATLMLGDGVNITAVARRLGHSSPMITLKHYAHAMPGDQDAAAESAERLFGHNG